MHFCSIHGLLDETQIHYNNEMKYFNSIAAQLILLRTMTITLSCQLIFWIFKRYSKRQQLTNSSFSLCIFVFPMSNNALPWWVIFWNAYLTNIADDALFSFFSSISIIKYTNKSKFCWWEKWADVQRVYPCLTKHFLTLLLYII